MDVQFSTADGVMGGYLAEPDTEVRGAIIVIQEAFGLTDHIASICDRLALTGYVAIAPALFHRVGSLVADYDDFASVLPAMGSLTAEGIAMDVDAVLAEFSRRGFTTDRIVGFCMGGTVALATGTRGVVGAAVTFYGGGVETGRFGYEPLVDLAPTLQCPWLGLYGDLDQSIPIDQVENLRQRAAEAAVPTQVVRYADAEHGFNCNDRSSFEASAAFDAWSRCLAWFETSLS